ncbi:hypothetical protein GCM10010413_09620 [Promicromonospora sukumoe]|uniref:Knr4/Smi1-like domain-containing protein n=1 Tax=Promicromonospora sukumoe TaxID=88382 RepID=A0A7W3J5E4_9MICO|nr:SMI1/KNR4 family protein [Promicromonospora sukumoe]MBA8806631.1 hypothetical protein [Promicromonospora sukumoe]
MTKPWLPLEPDPLTTGPALTRFAVEAAERELGVMLPAAYVRTLEHCNGGFVIRGVFRTVFPTSWAEDHFEVTSVLGIGGVFGIDSTSDTSSKYLIAEWEYPEIGIVIAHTPSGGHDTVMLDYREAAPGQPCVVYVDEDRVPRKIAESFDEFAAGLTDALRAE